MNTNGKTSPDVGTLSVQAALAHKSLLVTGTTGFLAKVWLSELLYRVPDVARVFVLIRGRKGQSAADRARKMFETSPAFRPLRAKYGSAYGAFLREKIVVVEGDATTPDFGIPTAWLGEIDAVVHSAGLTDFDPDPLLAIDANIEGAKTAALLASRCRGRALLHISTCFVAGERNGNIAETLQFGIAPNGAPFTPEQELFALRRVLQEVTRREPGRAAKARTEKAVDRARALGWPNIYTYTKGLAEHCVWEIAEREGVRATILRPSIVECAEQYPFTGWNEGVNTSAPIVWLVSTPLTHLPLRAEHAFDVVPVDTVTRAMHLALAQTFAQTRFEKPTILQVATSDHNRLTFHRAVDLTSFARAQSSASSWLDRINVTALASRNGTSAPSEGRAIQRASTWLRWGRDRLLDASKQFEGATPKLNKAARTLGGWAKTAQHVQQLLEAYEPFVWRQNYTFETKSLRSLSATLVGSETGDFAIRSAQLNWRDYWLNVQIPGLDRWSLPLLYGERVSVDVADDMVGELANLALLDLPKPRVRTRMEPESRATRIAALPRASVNGSALGASVTSGALGSGAYSLEGGE